MRVGDLVKVAGDKDHEMFISIITEICLPAQQRNGMHLVQVLEKGLLKWYPVGYIEVINANR